MLENNINESHCTDVTAIKICKNSPYLLISGCAGGEVKLWDPFLGNIIRCFSNNSGWVYKIILFEKNLNNNYFL